MDYTLLGSLSDKPDIQFDKNIVLKPKIKFSEKKKNISNDNDLFKNIEFDVERPFLKKETFKEKIMMDLIYKEGFYYAKIDNNLIKTQNLNNDDLILNIYGENFNLFLDNMKINCELISEDPVIFYVIYNTYCYMKYDENELKRLMEIKIYCLDKYIKYLEKNKYKFKFLADSINKFNKRRNINYTNNEILLSNNYDLYNEEQEIKGDNDSDNENYFENYY